MATSQSKCGRRFDEEFTREVAALACRPGARQEQVARDLGGYPYSVSRWKKQRFSRRADAPTGSPWLTVALRRAGERCGRHRVARLMHRVGLRARQKRRFRPRPTDKSASVPGGTQPLNHLTT